MYQSKLTGVTKAHLGTKATNAASKMVTRSIDAEGAHMSHREIEEMPKQDVTNMKNGIEYLESSWLMIPGALHTVEALVQRSSRLQPCQGLK